ncbi:hypothetical protein [Nitrosomonas ureae]|nr:hypothetical protein [Nitrosomonas ureae]
MPLSHSLPHAIIFSMAAANGNKYVVGKVRPRKVSIEDLEAFADDMLEWITEKLEDLISLVTETIERHKLAADELPPIKEYLIDVPTVQGYSKECGVAYRTLKKYCDKKEVFCRRMTSARKSKQDTSQFNRAGCIYTPIFPDALNGTKTFLFI